MKTSSIRITNYNDNRDRNNVIRLWKEVLGYSSPHNEPELSIDKKINVSDNLFIVALKEDRLIGTVMAGYDGHRGWVYSLAVFPEYQKTGAGTLLLKHAENLLIELGCVKINLQILKQNRKVVDFYQKNGYAIEKRISMGKCLI